MRKYSSKKMQVMTALKAAFITEYMKDFSARRAAEAVGRGPEWGYKMLEDPLVQEVIMEVVEERMDRMGVDAEWVLWELVDNHRIARQMGNISASNTALQTIAKHVSVDAMAKQKLEIEDITDKDLLDRLRKGRQRVSGQIDGDSEVSFL